MIQIKPLKDDHQIASSYSVMKQLRPHLQEDTYLQQIRRLEQEYGYRLVAVLDQNEIKALAGFRIAENLGWGRYLYIDDFVTDEQNRKQGYGKRLFDWLVKEAKDQHCQELHLDSRVHRVEAHRFYLKNYMMIRSHHFVLPIQS